MILYTQVHAADCDAGRCRHAPMAVLLPLPLPRTTEDSLDACVHESYDLTELITIHGIRLKFGVFPDMGHVYMELLNSITQLARSHHNVLTSSTIRLEAGTDQIIWS
ncbi:hypothetical protein ACQJBY_025712 [Aegilops geniculata]